MTLLPLAIAFLTPWFFAAGAALVAIPILIHILNRRRYKVIQWAAMDYLLKAMKKNRRRLKFESLLLLLTRCALLMLLGLALARPFGCENNSVAGLAGRRSGLHVLVIDNGYAMGYQFDRGEAKTHLQQAKIIAKSLINRLSNGSEAVVVLTTASQPAGAETTLPTPIYDLEQAKAVVDRIEQTYAGTDMAGALDRARRVAAAAPQLPNKTLYLLDDSTHHIWAGKQQDVLPPIGKDLAGAYKGGIIHFNLGKPNEYNHAVTNLTSSQRLVTLLQDFPPNFVATVKAYGSGSDPQLQWKTDDTKLAVSDNGIVHLDMNDQPQTLTNPQFPSGGPHVVSASLVGDDHLKCDDTRWRVVNVASDLKMLLVEGERQVGPTGGSGMFLHAALEPDPIDAATRVRNLVNIDTISDLELGTKPLGDYRCIALCGVGGLTDATAARLEKFARDGGAVWIFVGPQVSADNYNATLGKHHLLPGPLVQRITEPATSEGRKFDFDPSGAIDPLLEVFKGDTESGLQNARVFSYWQADLPANSTVERVLDYQPSAGATRKDPAITVQSLGQGRVVFCSTTASANEEWTTFPAKKSFPEVMLCLFLGTVNTGDDWMNISVGDVVQPPTYLKLTAAPKLKDASGAEFVMTESQTADGDVTYQSIPLKKPGVYTMTAGTASYPVAVNVQAEESDTRLVDQTGITKALGGINIAFEDDSLPRSAVSLNQGADMGWSLMAVVLALVAAESFMAMQFGHYKKK